MDILHILFIATGLAADAFAVSVSSGAIIERLRLRHAMRIALFFGFFQGMMPWIGWKVGNLAEGMIQTLDHWLAFVILSAVGARMIYESRHQGNVDKTIDPLNIYILFSLAIATSIDALAVGLTFSFLNTSILEPVLIIGLVTFVLSLAGTYVGKHFGHVFEDKIELAGGVILIGIGARILIEHTLF